MRADGPGGARLVRLMAVESGRIVPREANPERDTGELREAQIFVAVLGASNYTYAEATWTQTPADWIASHVRAFEFCGGCREILVPTICVRR